MLLSSSDNKRKRCIYSCLQIPPRENWFQYVRRVYASPINFPCISTLVLRIHLILKRIRILDPHWKKMDPDPVHEKKLRFTYFFHRKIFELFFLLFHLFFSNKFCEPFRDQDISDNLSFFNNSDLSFG